METCHEYLGCDKTDCVMHGAATARPCWEVEGTLCNHHGIALVRAVLPGRKEDSCVRSGCIYYRAFKSAVDSGRPGS
ncbi:MAG: hypothetical protein Q9Q40_07010 [Acidobacteriota bacterium]|nr:hypothetical protein [Acidobacteriota bacterium]MDQ7088248.1 hypothetical protein [Acidobacteriota bacterium]